MIQLMIIADDFTGSLDTGVQFAEKGIRTRVVTDPSVDYEQAAEGCEVLVVVAETRHMDPASAYGAVYRIVQKSRDIGIGHIYKKTDSALRGNIGAELTAALDVGGTKTLAFLPSMPGAGIADADAMKTGLRGMLFALVGFLVPFVFVYNPAILL